MDLDAIKLKIDREFSQQVEKIDALYRKASFGKATYKDASKLADASGKAMADVLIRNLEDFGYLLEDDMLEIIPRALLTNHSYLSPCIENVQGQINKKVKVGLKPVVPEFNLDRADGLAKEVARWGTLEGFQDKFRQQVINNSVNVIDEAIQGNARQHDHAGLDVTVEREYDGVGLHGGKDTCNWCLERAGSWDYSDAVANGVFQRHPGCGCRLTYTSERGTDFQTDWTSNTWTRIVR